MKLHEWLVAVLVGGWLLWQLAGRLNIDWRQVFERLRELFK